MSSPASVPVLPFAELLDELRRHGFVIGLDQHLRMQLLLDRLAGECPPERLKSHLAPIFATSKAEQERFHRIFDRLYPVFAEVEREEQQRHSGHTGESPVHLRPATETGRRRWVVAGLVLLLVLLLLGLWRWLGPGPERISQVTVAPAPAPLPTPGGDAPAPRDSVSTLRALPNPDTLPPAPAPPRQEGFFQRHRTGTRIILVALALAAFLLNEWRLYQRRRLVVSRERRQKPPFTWPVRLESPANPYAQSADLPNAARLLRQREAGDVARLSVEATITATIAALGFPTFRYRTDTRAPDYLLLIERSAHRDHAARLYQALGKALEREGVHVTRYLHDGDPRVCYSENGEQRELLVDLRRRFPDYRVLLFSKGERLVDQVTGRLHSWTTQFLSWSDRAILTPESPATWGLREVALAQHFVVLPATTAGLVGVVGHFRGPARPDPSRWQALDQDPAAPRLDQDDPLPTLQSYLGPRVYRWLCACAVYPELHWDLTLHFGSLTILGPGLISEENLLRLLRLPWFRQGTIPDEIRVRLIDGLTEAEERAVRQAIVELLERNPAPGDSVSANRYELDLVVQRLALHRRDPRERRAAMRDLAGFPRRELVQDFAMLKLIEETPSSRLQVLLPRRLRRVFYRGGVPVLGVRAGVRAGILGAVLLAGWMITSPLQSTSYMPHGLSFSDDGSLELLVGEHAAARGVFPLTRALLDGNLNGLVLEWSIEPESLAVIDRGEVIVDSIKVIFDSINRKVEKIQTVTYRDDTFKGLSSGKGVLTARLANGKIVRWPLRVDLPDVGFATDSVELVVGDIRQLDVVILNQDNRRLPREFSDRVNWTSSDTGVVRVRQDGVVEVVGAGRASVAVRLAGSGASMVIQSGTGARAGTLSPADSSSASADVGAAEDRTVARLRVEPAHLELRALQSADVSVLAVGTDGIERPANQVPLKLSSSDPRIAMAELRPGGVVIMGQVPGRATIVFESGTAKAFLVVRVEPSPVSRDTGLARVVVRRFGEAIGKADLPTMLKLYPGMPDDMQTRYLARFSSGDTTGNTGWGEGKLVPRGSAVTIRSDRLIMLRGADGRARPIRVPRMVTLIPGPESWTIVGLTGEVEDFGLGSLTPSLDSLPLTGKDLAARLAVETTVQRLAEGLSEGDLKTLDSVFPTMPEKVREAYGQMFRERWTLNTRTWKILAIRISGDSAFVSLGGTTRTVDSQHRLREEIAWPREIWLQRQDERWRVVSISGESGAPDPASRGIQAAPEATAESAPGDSARGGRGRRVPEEALKAYGRALLYQDLDSLPKASDSFREALRIYPEYAEALEGLTRVLVRQRLNDWTKHLEGRNLAGLLQLYPGMPERDQQAWKRLLENPSVTRLSVTQEGVNVELTGNGAATVRYSLVYTVDSRPGGRKVSVSRYLTTFALVRGAWQVTSMQGVR